ncbi:MAG: response regulator transcription factor [Burkholderiales bacterium]|nr:response regulator transcription factor [Burkholderiales bacterium]
MLMTETIDVLVMHENPLVAAGVVATLGARPQFDVRLHDSRTAPPGQEYRPDVVIADYHAGLDLIGRAGRERLGGRAHMPRVLIVTTLDREWEIRSALEHGVHGYLLMNCALDELIEGVQTLSLGSRYLCVAVARRIAESVGHEALTNREIDVLRLVATGLCNKSIATQLDIAVGTVKAHVKSILEKLNASTRTQAAAVAARRGLIRERAEPRESAPVTPAPLAVMPPLAMPLPDSRRSARQPILA